MNRAEDGSLLCPDDSDGRTASEIDQQRALDASAPSMVRGKTPEGP